MLSTTNRHSHLQNVLIRAAVLAERNRFNFGDLEAAVSVRCRSRLRLSMQWSEC